MATEIPSSSGRGWRLPASTLSLPEVHGSVAIPHGAGFWRKMLAFAGPGYLVAVGYMDPGNWATDLAGGARYGYTLLSVIMISNLMAILLQALSARLGIASGRSHPFIEAIGITAASATAGWPISAHSSATLLIHSPPLLIRSFVRSCT